MWSKVQLICCIFQLHHFVVWCTPIKFHTISLQEKLVLATHSIDAQGRIFDVLYYGRRKRFRRPSVEAQRLGGEIRFRRPMTSYVPRNFSHWAAKKFVAQWRSFFISWATKYNFVAHVHIGRRKVSSPTCVHFVYLGPRNYISWPMSHIFWTNFLACFLICFGQHFCICALFQSHIFLSLLNAYQCHLFLGS